MTFGDGDRFFTRIEQQAKLQTRSAAADPAHQRIGEALGDKIFTVSAVLLWAALTAVTFAAYWSGDMWRSPLLEARHPRGRYGT